MKRTICLIIVLSLTMFILCSCAGQSTMENSTVSVACTMVNETVSDVYAKFLRVHIPTTEVDIEKFADGSDEKMRLEAFMAGGYPITPFFYLYDMDKDESPELLFIDPVKGYDVDVYSHKKNEMSKIGCISFYPFGSIGIPLDKKAGLYNDTGYKGHYGEMYCYVVDNGVLTNQLVLEYNNQSDVSPEEPGSPYSFDNFDSLDFYQNTEENIIKVIY